jgi:predicted RNA-binding Zn-ribbon protein involved in translation (DUF1610 family)
MSAMRCPTCNVEMRAGRIGVERDGAEAFWLGHASMPLRSFRFRPESGTEAVAPKLSNVAFLCPDCDTVVLPGALSEPLECFECGATIPGDAERCAACGWTWKGQ